ncbi:hypothetical protein DQ393_26575 [Rhizobium tropici]|uniref:Uncharacterized protein n=1 Tax=Rhizobium tropici TaxID=398 RepID=A0A329Y533_RHITR|nr:hypothetical protein DQ393_26575 [Rhizobium tropici]
MTFLWHANSAKACIFYSDRSILHVLINRCFNMFYRLWLSLARVSETMRILMRDKTIDIENTSFFCHDMK